jgi:protoporphyrin/coproporphyrin ferrochelatase
METTGVLLMAYGGPDSLDDVEPYLLDVRGGRPTSNELVEEIRDRYAQIGGRSPLLEITRNQAQALEDELNRRCAGERKFKVYVGMRHWTPRIRETAAQMQNDGIKRSAAMVMAPHYSSMSTEVYLKRLQEALEDLRADIDIIAIRSWHDHPGLISAISEKVKKTILLFEPDRPFVVFTAHSLPARIQMQGDPYPDQLNETARLLAESLDLPAGRWMFSFQSAGRTGEPWLGPQIEEVIPELASRGEQNILVVPVGFVSDHVEVLYDIDIEAHQQATRLGSRLERSESLNTSTTFIKAMADLVLEQLQTEE